MSANKYNVLGDYMEKEEKRIAMSKKELYEKQVALLKLFLEKNAISQEQFDKSYGDLTEKMGFENSEN